jgi:hypothetical protein
MPKKSELTDPYLSMLNLEEWIERKNVRANTGLINGKLYVNGKTYTPEEYEAEFAPIELLYQQKENPDGTRIRK